MEKTNARNANMRNANFAYTVWQWGVQTEDQFRQALGDITEAGFFVFESVKAAIDVFGHDSERFMAVCREYGARPNGFYFHLTGDWDEDVGEFRRKLPFMAACGIHRLSFQGTGMNGRLHATREELGYNLKVLDAVGKLASEYGILPCVHPHHNTAIMFEDEIDYILENADPERVAFGPDTAHLVAGQCDPVAVIRKYAGRVKFIHLKDIASVDVASEGYAAGVEVYSSFCELGRGMVDFPGVFGALDGAGYDGDLTVELDKSRTTNKESAIISMKYLQAHCGKG
jgi:inosose dehydratase